MKKRIFSILLALTLCLSLLPTTALAETSTSGTCGATGDHVTWALTQNNTDAANPTYTLSISGSGAMADYSNGSQPWYQYQSNINTIILNSGITHIGAHSLRGTQVTSLTIPNSVETIGNYALIQNKALKSIVVEGENANRNFKVDNDVIFTSYSRSDGTTGWELSYFPIAKYDASYTVPAFVTAIGANSMQKAAFTSVTIPSTCSINSYAFAGNVNLTSVSLPDDVTFGTEGTNIGSGYDGVFSGCSSLKTVNNFENANIDSIGQSVFQGTQVSDINIPNTVKSIDGNAFSNPNGSVKVVFQAGSNLNEIKASSCFTAGTYDVYFDESDLNAYLTFVNAGFVAHLGSKVLPTSEYYVYEFNGQNTVTILGLTEEGKTKTDLLIPAYAGGYRVAEISQSAFEGNSTLESVEFEPGPAIIVGEKAFYSCTALKSFNAGMREISLGKMALGNDSSLKTVIIPNTKEVSDYTFLISYNVSFIVINEDSTLSENALKRNAADGKFFFASSNATGYKAFIVDNGLTTEDSDLQDSFKGIPEGNIVVILKLNGGTFEDNTNFASGKLPASTKTGYTFAGWYTEQTGGTKIESISDTQTEDMTLYARWTAIDYDITYELDGGTNASTNPSSYTVESAAITLKNPTRSGYVFTGWSGTGLDGEDNLTVTIAKGSTGNRSYVAHWRAIVASKPVSDVDVKSSLNGSVSVDRDDARQGSIVTVTVAPNAGSALDALTVVDANGNAVAVTHVGGNKYSFIMPATDVTVRASFTDGTATGFVDVPADKYFYNAVNWAVANGITSGVDATHFAPYASCTRGQLVTFLWRAAGQPAAKATENAFSDVRENSAFYQAILWAAENGIVTGYADGTFQPNKAISRQQTAAILYRYAKYAGMDVSAGEDSNILSFNDATSVSEYAVAAFQWATGAQVITGNAGSLLPYDTCTRAQIVTMLYRLLAK